MNKAITKTSQPWPLQPQNKCPGSLNTAVVVVVEGGKKSISLHSLTKFRTILSTIWSIQLWESIAKPASQIKLAIVTRWPTAAPIRRPKRAKPMAILGESFNTQKRGENGPFLTIWFTHFTNYVTTITHIHHYEPLLTILTTLLTILTILLTILTILLSILILAIIKHIDHYSPWKNSPCQGAQPLAVAHLAILRGVQASPGICGWWKCRFPWGFPWEFRGFLYSMIWFNGDLMEMSGTGNSMNFCDVKRGISVWT